MKKNDWILIAAGLLICVVTLGIYFLRPQQAGIVEVRVDGEEFGTWSLSENLEITIGETNRLCIEEGYADMVWADCPDKLCVHQRAISREGESIICLPNKVVVSILGGEKRKTDAISR